MKLLTPLQTINKKENEIALNLSRSLELQKELDKKKIDLEKLNIEFEIVNRKQQQIREEFNETSIKELEIFNQDVKDLENRKKDALVPLDEKWKELDKAEELIKKREENLKIKEEEVISKIELLEEKLDDLAEKQKIVDEMSLNQAEKQRGIDSQRKQIKLQSESLNSLISKHSIEEENRLKYINTKEAELNSKAIVLESLDKDLKTREQALKDKETQIQDKYETLQRTINRINK